MVGVLPSISSIALKVVSEGVGTLPGTPRNSSRPPISTEWVSVEADILFSQQPG
jgi:hypothetical protein